VLELRTQKQVSKTLYAMIAKLKTTKAN
jgi:hypothetical protein